MLWLEMYDNYNKILSSVISVNPFLTKPQDIKPSNVEKKNNTVRKSSKGKEDIMSKYFSSVFYHKNDDTELYELIFLDKNGNYVSHVETHITPAEIVAFCCEMKIKFQYHQILENHDKNNVIYKSEDLIQKESISIDNRSVNLVSLVEYCCQCHVKYFLEALKTPIRTKMIRILKLRRTQTNNIFNQENQIIYNQDIDAPIQTPEESIKGTSNIINFSNYKNKPKSYTKPL